ncbi:MAG: peptide chain release factor N(5)-glutamine methyltransferase [Flavobacteriales bacterium]|nr:peptide chain release factor N(5)-glutamine methyltransferase [Flavobacteriales bacterium]
MNHHTVKAWVDQYREALSAIHGQAETRAIIRVVLQDRIGISMLELDRELSGEQIGMLTETLERIRSGEPIQYALGHVDFHGLRLAVDRRVLIPRPETEELVERIVRSHDHAPELIVDIGTGSGCIALALKKAFPKAKVMGMDRSAEALEVAKANAAANHLQVEWMECDALGPELLPLLKNAWCPGQTLVVSNPPYVPQGDRSSMQEQVLQHEPHLALFVEDDDPHKFYRAIAAVVGPTGHPGDALWFEAHYRYAPETAAVINTKGFTGVEVFHDLSGNPRFIHAWK